MKSTKYLFILFTLTLFNDSLKADILWVGDSSQCNQSNHYENLDNALFAAAFNGTGTNDEIRLTNTVTYTGNGDGVYSLNNWNSNASGELTIAGGYSNCGSAQDSANTMIGDGNGSVFTVSNNSMVTLRKVQLFGSNSRGLRVLSGSSVILQSVNIFDHEGGGAEVTGGSYLEMDIASIIQNSGNLSGLFKGGGILCNSNNSAVKIMGTLRNNNAIQGGNIYLDTGCFVSLEGGSVIQGQTFTRLADSGGGIMVHNGGELIANGGAQRVLFLENEALFGGALYVWGTGKATLLNTFFQNSYASEKGGAIYAINGGISTNQVLMDRAADCPFLISCSEFENNDYEHSVVYVNNSMIQINRTIFDQNTEIETDNFPEGLVYVEDNAKLRMSHVNMVRNTSRHLIVNWGDTEVAHMTAALNSFDNSQNGTGPAYAFSNFGSANIRLENSLFQDTGGGGSFSGSDTVSGKCNLVNNNVDWPPGSYVISAALLNNPAGGDTRQQANSNGVDMCQADTFVWNNDRDIEYQVSPVNESTNPQGLPGESGGLYDAGFDEVYGNIGKDDLIFIDGFE